MLRRFRKELLSPDAWANPVNSAERSSIRTHDALLSTSTATEWEQPFRLIGRSDSCVAEGNKNRAWNCKMTGFLTTWMIPVLVLAAPAARGGSTTPEAVQRTRMIANRNCRTLASKLIIKVNSTRCSFGGSREGRTFSSINVLLWRFGSRIRTFLHEPVIGLIENTWLVP